MMGTIREITTLLQAFQEGYTRRDASQVDAFMDLFTDHCEVIGANGIKPGVDEWYTSCTRPLAGNSPRSTSRSQPSTFQTCAFWMSTSRPHSHYHLEDQS